MTMRPNVCTICQDALLGPPPPNATVFLETDIHNVVKAYHVYCINRLFNTMNSNMLKGPFYGYATVQEKMEKGNASNSQYAVGAPSQATRYSGEVSSMDDVTAKLREEVARLQKEAAMRDALTSSKREREY